MLRSAAKNHEFVLPVVDPTDYPTVLDLLRRDALDADGPPRVRGQGVRPHRRLRRGHRGLPDAARRRGCPSRLGLAMERAADAPLRREPGPARRALRDRGAARHARPHPAPGQGALLQQPARHRRGDVGGGLLEHPARLLHHQAHDALRHRGRRAPRARRSGRRAPPTPSPPSARSSPSTRWWTAATAAGDERPVRRGGRGAVVPRRGAGGVRGEEGAARGRAAGEPRHRLARLQAGARRLPGAGPVRVRPLGPGLDGRHRPAAHRAGVERPPVRLGRGRRRSSRTPSCWPATRWRSASAPDR